MDKLWNLVGWSKQGTARDASEDDVYPLHAFDDLKTRRIFVTRVLRFNDFLNAEMLIASLSRLFEIGDWRKLGGRLRYKVSIIILAAFIAGHESSRTESYDIGRRTARDSCAQTLCRRASGLDIHP